MRVFLAEDDPDDLDFFSLALKKVNSDAVLTVASNGAQALEYLKSADTIPHFVFLDINMPLVNGIECLKHIRLIYPQEVMPVIMLSTSGSPQMIRESFSHGATFYVQKPNHLNDLTERIRYCLEEVVATAPSSRYFVNS